MERFDAQIKSADKSGFVAIASRPNLDRDGEILQARCFEASRPLPARVPVLLFHRHDDPVGNGRPYYDGNDLMIDGKFSTTARAEEARTMVLDGTIGHVSVGFTGAVRKSVNGVPHVVAGELLEVSLVTVPSLREAAILSARSHRAQDPFMRWVYAELAKAQQALADMAVADAKRVIADVLYDPYLRRTAGTAGPARCQVDKFLKEIGL